MKARIAKDGTISEFYKKVVIGGVQKNGAHAA